MFCSNLDKHKGQRAVGEPAKYWKVGETISVSFIGGTIQQKEFVKFWASKWTEIVNLKFDWVSSGVIRIAFTNDGAWSYVGTECKSILEGATMNLGWIDKDIIENNGSTVLHEFGHALGLHHEHQNPNGGIKWNKPVVIKALSGAPNYWSIDTINHNVFDKIDNTNYTVFDPTSIMLYSFPKEWTIDGFQAPWNSAISIVDADFLSNVYPKAVTPVTKLIDLKKVFLKELELTYLSLLVIQRLAKEFNIEIVGKTKKQLTQLIFKLL